MKTFLIAALVLFSSAAYASANNKNITTIELVALHDNLAQPSRDNVRIYLENIVPSSPTTLGNWKLQLIKATKKALQALGYYQPTINIETQYIANKFLATLDIDQGIATTISDMEITIKGDADTDLHFKQIIEMSALKQGAQFNHSQYQGLKNAINDAAISRGYFKAQWLTTTVAVEPEKNKAKVTLIFDSGPRFKFGEIIFTVPSQAQPIIETMSNFTQDMYYHSELLAQYNLDLAQSKYFAAIEVYPDLQQIRDNSVPIVVNIVEKPANSLEVGGGFSSNYGLRGRIKWTKPWLNKYGHSLSSELKLATTEQSFAAIYKIPIEDPIHNYGTIALGWQNINLNDTRTTKYSLLLQRHRLLNSRWKRGVFIRLERENSIQGSIESTSTNIIPGVSFARTRLKGGLHPYWGDRQSLTLEFGHQGWGSDANLAKAMVRSKWLRSYNINHQFIASADMGAIWANSIDDVPVSMRLFGGGDENLRAYKFDGISPIDQYGELTGGLYQANLTLEYSYMFLPNWRIATFVDTGTTTNDFTERLKTDVGFGFRWQTPVGPIRLDFAFGLTKDPDYSRYDRPFRISFSIGPQL
ncbi:MAG: outer membrane protein assembly factor [Gammaproteobacteria bacterium]|nr:outer membrane protein assembly factor [Gammaproteobacteria bacterium]